jgi:peptide-methionine (S)-S-oxide reductase
MLPKGGKGARMMRFGGETLRFAALLGLAAGLVLTEVLAADEMGSGNAAFDETKATEGGKYAVATFAGGCFWCMQHPYDATKGVVSTTVGFTGGTVLNPSYQEVSAGGTGHAESIDVVYDPAVVSYQQLLDTFWHNIDPLVKDRQFCDGGNQYRSAIFFHDAEQKRLAEESKAKLQASGKLQGQIVTEIVEAGPFYPAEDYHQEYYKKSPVHYKFYRWNCGRDQRLKMIWGADAPMPEVERE